MVTIGFGMMLSSAIFYGLYLPHARFLRLSVLAAEVLKQHGATGPGSALMVDYKEPSLAFYQGGSIREAPHAAVVESGDVARWTPWMVITRDVWNHSPPDVRAKLQVVATFHGLSPSDGMAPSRSWSCGSADPAIAPLPPRRLNPAQVASSTA